MCKKLKCFLQTVSSMRKKNTKQSAMIWIQHLPNLPDIKYQKIYIFRISFSKKKKKTTTFKYTNNSNCSFQNVCQTKKQIAITNIKKCTFSKIHTRPPKHLCHWFCVFWPPFNKHYEKYATTHFTNRHRNNFRPIYHVALQLKEKNKNCHSPFTPNTL